MSKQVFAFEVNVAGREWAQTVNALSAGKAKYEYWRDVQDSWPDIPFTAIRVRKVGAPVSSPDFLRMAKYRGISVRCGDSVTLKDGATGVVVGHNSSANMDVLFMDGKYAGLTLNVHPGSLATKDAQ